MNVRGRRSAASRCRGFTLLEVLLAAAVLAIALGAVLTVVRDHAAQARTLRAQTLAHWVAVDRVLELRLARAWPPPGLRRGELVQGDRTWHWREQVHAGAEPDLRAVTVQVREHPGGAVLAQGRGWLARPE